MKNSLAIGITFLVYLIGMFAIGVIAYMRTKNLSEFLLGGRRLNFFTSALSAGASDMSGWLLLGLPGFAYVAGFEAGWIALGLFVGTYINWRFIAKKLRVATVSYGDAITLSEYFENRFNDSSRLLRVITALFTLVFFLFYTSSGLVAGGKLFTSVFGLSYIWAVTIGVSAIILYTFLGGFMAVCWTDCIQGLLMVLALVLVPIMAIAAQGGCPATFDAIGNTNSALLNPLMSRDGNPLSLIAIISLMAWGLGYFGQPHILTRFMAIDSVDKVPQARKVALWWVAFGMVGALMAGFAGVGALEAPLSEVDSEKVFILLVQSLLHPIPAGICLAAILAAIMSTADSQLLVASSALTEDIYRPFIRTQASQVELVWVGRAAVIVIALVAYFLALNPQNKILDLVAYAWAGFGATFGPTIFLSLYWKKMTRLGALAGIVTGGVTVVIWKQLSGGIFELYEIVPGFILSTIAIVVVGVFTQSLKNEN